MLDFSRASSASSTVSFRDRAAALVKRAALSLGRSSVIALIIAVLLQAFQVHFTWSAAFYSLAFSWVYSHTIGTLLQFVIPPVWPHLSPLRPVLRWSLFALVLLATAIVGSLIGGVIAVLIGLNGWHQYWPEFWISVRISTAVTMVFGSGGTAFEVLRSQLETTTLELRTKELERERALKLATEARLSSLESRIHPHFLFNTLNSISSLIREDPLKAERLIERMAALLRFSLDASETGAVTLDREMKIVEDYLEIERARFGQRLVYAIHVPPGLLSCELPPLSIQTLAENAVKYAIATRRGGGRILISAATAHGSLEVTVSDNGPGFESTNLPPGHGLDNLQARLQAQFGPQAGITIRRDGEYTRVIVQAPQTALAARHLATV